MPESFGNLSSIASLDIKLSIFRVCQWVIHLFWIFKIIKMIKIINIIKMIKIKICRTNNSSNSSRTSASVSRLSSYFSQGRARQSLLQNAQIFRTKWCVALLGGWEDLSEEGRIWLIGQSRKKSWRQGVIERWRTMRWISGLRWSNNCLSN